MSLLEARNLNHNYITPEHILLGLIREAEGVAFTILSNLGLDAERLRKELIKNLSGQETPKDEGSKKVLKALPLH